MVRGAAAPNEVNSYISGNCRRRGPFCPPRDSRLLLLLPQAPRQRGKSARQVAHGQEEAMTRWCRRVAR
jgi:hypothetical protein